MSFRWPWSEPPATKKCRFCFKEIPGEAEVCPLCGETVVRVSPQMVKTLLVVLVVALSYLVVSTLFTRGGQDPEANYAQGLIRGREAGARQGRVDASRGEPRRETMPARLRVFLRDKDRSFREGFEQGFVRAYYQAYEEEKDQGLPPKAPDRPGGD